MAVLSVKETFAEERAERNTSAETFIRTFLIETDGVTTRRDQILDAADLPQMGDAYPFTGRPDPNRSLHVVDMQAFRKPGSNTAWDVIVVYSSQGIGGGVTNPFNRFPVVRMFTQPYQRVVDREVFHVPDRLPGDNRTADHDQRETSGDLERLPILNTAGERFDPLPEIDAGYPGLEIIRNEPAWSGGAIFSWIQAVNYSGTINRDRFQVLDAWIEPYQARVFIDAQMERQSGVTFWSVSYKLIFSRDTWLMYILNQGYKRRLDLSFPSPNPDPESIYVFPIKTDDNELISEPAPLGWNGDLLAAGDLPIFLRFHVHDERDFSVLNLPRSIGDIIILPGD